MSLVVQVVAEHSVLGGLGLWWVPLLATVLTLVLKLEAHAWSAHVDLPDR